MGPCPQSQYGYGHDASVRIEDGAVIPLDGGYIAGDEDYPHDDPRWPSACACGYVFQTSDRSQCRHERIYVRPDTGEGYELRPGTTPPGAMWDATWLTDTWRGPDGRCLEMVLPDGHWWCIDGPSTSGGGWTRTGVPPRITARPSILSPRYHGWLTDGVLSDDLEGRTY